ncbi:MULTISPECIES: RdgB/HAM1 family non-canonical purine NTP pyrophosphatase [Acidithiobacillus]|uniref:dITP/XTP pyrophosphatase n=1 Tax=Acidithiobacillus caldus (strain SM-1) TaxID=990288 RepID=F9ZRB7_ACICS|nr:MULTISPECIES: RdgB/HAM1 family non-canonical purine NTP pyrophosphatase [Acidithiobacillus]AEK58915.1 Nucleoside 5-triphosphatase RdgB (dHAPTP, dITP, XTP-specific) [Acidithiobacillus caldus SM-1]MCY0872958.1 RdgB/HAM1 family non-canonical purine NTP pyrophosphatase [Acidithiobacillus caldus]WMT48124.1 MAG: RdgB/HAM1 family non-canonical purine NTP pyrophosphatase [Acidithiobacillus caldus]
MALSREWLLATHNRGKVAELAPSLQGYGVRLRTLADFDLPSPEENGGSFLENALLKARAGFSATGLPTLAEDSGLCVAALDGAPGIHSARFAGPDADDAENNRLLLERMRGLRPEERTAHFHCCMVLLHRSDDPEPLVAQGLWSGSIADAALGTGGFGYDPVFIPFGDLLTAAQLEPEIKRLRSHRAMAIRSLLALLDALYPSQPLSLKA